MTPVDPDYNLNSDVTNPVIARIVITSGFTDGFKLLNTEPEGDVIYHPSCPDILFLVPKIKEE